MIDMSTKLNGTNVNNNSNNKPKILILSHGKMCEGIVESARFIGLDVSNIIAMPMEEVVNIQTYEGQIRNILDSFPKGSLVFVDFLGGTPFNIIARILADYDIYAITGVNLPMVIEVSTSCEILKGKELQSVALETGKNGIIDINSFVNSL